MAVTAVTLGQHLRALRQAKGWRQLDVAIATELTPATVSQIENGLRLPTGLQLEALAAALGVEVRDLLGA